MMEIKSNLGKSDQEILNSVSKTTSPAIEAVNKKIHNLVMPPNPPLPPISQLVNNNKK